MFDKYYTDARLASILVNIVPKSFKPAVVADFSCGEGSLLKAAKRKWEDLEIIANDYCPDTVSELKSHNWAIYNLDFLKKEQVNNSEISNYFQKIDLVLLNPPFNQDDVRLLHWDNCSEIIQSSIPLSFVYYSMLFLKENGYLVAILPNGCLTSDRDKLAFKFLSKNYTLEIVNKNCDSSFRNANPRVSIVKIKNTKPDTLGFPNINESIKTSRLDIVRGNIQMHRVKSNKKSEDYYPLVHTTNLKEGQVEVDNKIIISSNNIIRGPAILLPRVGNFNQDKICYLPMHSEVAVSDCIFAIICDNEFHAEEIRTLLLETWVSFKEIYSGTGALYTTLSKLKIFFDENSGTCI